MPPQSQGQILPKADGRFLHVYCVYQKLFFCFVFIMLGCLFQGVILDILKRFYLFLALFSHMQDPFYTTIQLQCDYVAILLTFYLVF